MKVLVACEFSGTVREAFRSRGHEVLSCDLLPATDGSDNHYVGDVADVIGRGWDIIIAHPPCTYLAVSGNRWYANRPDLYLPAIDFASSFFEYADRVAVENPVGRLGKMFRKADQYVHPWMFGDPFSKKTGLWLKGLPLLEPTNIVDKGERHVTKSGKSLPTWYNLPPSAERSNIRSTTFKGFAEAMAAQWG